jgi:formamidopyrimidine-DNA glycosylase
MPELPEVETIVRGLRECLPGKTVSGIAVHREKQVVNTSVSSFKSFLVGETFESVGRFGKYLHFLFSSGKQMVTHLRMTGKFIDPCMVAGDAELRHVRIEFEFTDGSRLLYNDPRTFGTFTVYPAGATPPEMNRIGSEPLDLKLTARMLAFQAKIRTIPVKVVLLDQKFIAGLGNIYVCEALFHAGIDPARAACDIPLAEWDVLLEAIRSVLRRAIDLNGTSISDFRSVDDKTGQFQDMLMVYQRTGEPCRKCGELIERIRQSQRSTFFCPHCQS